MFCPVPGGMYACSKHWLFVIIVIFHILVVTAYRVVFTYCLPQVPEASDSVSDETAAELKQLDF